MRAPHLLVALLVAACASGAPPAGTPSPAPPTPRPNVDPGQVEPVPAATPAIVYPVRGAGILHYALTRQDSIAAIMPNGEEQVQLLGRTAFVTLTWVAADTGTRFTAVVDSVQPDTAFGIPGLALDSAIGARYTGFRLTSGRFRDLATTNPSLIAGQVRDQLRLLFPTLPPEGALQGTVWSDTLTSSGWVSAFEATENIWMEATAAPHLDADGAMLLQVERLRVASGEGMQFGQPMTVRGTGTDTLSYRLASDGRVLSASGVRRSQLVIDLPSVGQSVQASETSLLGMRLLP